MTLWVWGSHCFQHMRQGPVSSIWDRALCQTYETVPQVQHMRKYSNILHMRQCPVSNIWGSAPTPAYEGAPHVQQMRQRPVSSRRCFVVSTNSACCQSLSSSLDLSLLRLFTKFPPYFTPFLLSLSTLVTSTIRYCHQASQHFLLNSAPACLNIYIFVKWIHDMSSSTNCCH